MRFRLARKDVERAILYVLIDVFSILLTLNILRILLDHLGIDVDFSRYGCLSYCYPYYMLAASSYILLLLLLMIRIFVASRVLSDLIVTLLLISSILFYLDLFSRRGVNIIILPLMVIFSKESYQSITLDLGQISLLTFALIILFRLKRGAGFN
ncbi:MAG: hypothetical protein ABWJ42_02350 [Sulfolobales archaeon]